MKAGLEADRKRAAKTKGKGKRSAVATLEGGSRETSRAKLRTLTQLLWRDMG